MPSATNKNIYIRSVSCKHRKSCPTCKVKLPPGEQIYSSGSYARMKWYTVNHFCKQCYNEVIKDTAQEYCDSHGAMVHVHMYKGERRPFWLHSVITSTLAVLQKV